MGSELKIQISIAERSLTDLAFFLEQQTENVVNKTDLYTLKLT